MKNNFLAGLILITLISTSILGFIGLSFVHNDSVAKGHCAASAAAGVTCPIEDGIFAFAAFHIKAFGGLVQAAFFSVSPIFLLTILVLTIALLFSALGFLFSVSSRKYFRKNYEYKICDSGPKIISWLSLFELSPAFIKGV